MASRSRDLARDGANKVEAQFRGWAGTIDCDASHTLYLLDLTALDLGAVRINGDAISKWLPQSDSLWSTRISVMGSERLATPPHTMGAARIRHGGGV